MEREELVSTNDLKHVTRVCFREATYVAPSLVGASDFVDVSQFSIITGPNGSGKSQLLRYINKVLTEDTNFTRGRGRDESKKVIYIPSDHRLDTLYATSGTDTSYSISYEKVYEQCVNEVGEFFSEGTEPTLPFAKLVVKNITLELDDNKVTCADITPEYIRTIARKTIDYGLNELRLSDPIGFLTYIFSQFEKRKKVIEEEETGKISAILSLWDFYDKDLDVAELNAIYKKCALKENGIKLEMRVFIGLVSCNSEFRKELRRVFSQKGAGRAPWEFINDILAKHGFKYKVGFAEGRGRGEGVIKFTKDGIDIESKDLSSGEIMILCVMSWQYYAYGLSSDPKERQIDNEVKIILLDEPDKHLDPRLCKLFYQIVYGEFVVNQGIQVIMATHRTDTMALMPDGLGTGIFTIKKNERNEPEIVPITKLHAMFRLTHNLRALTNLHVKVYVESHDDAEFYEGVYNALMNYCDVVRADNQKLVLEASSAKPSRHWAQIQVAGVDNWESRVMSRRFQLSFFSTCFEKGGSGGGLAVEQMVRRDINSRPLHATMSGLDKWLNRDSALVTQPFGVLDRDYGYYKFQHQDQAFQRRFIKLRRHSLENYLHDPFIVISACNLNTIQEGSLRAICNDLKSAVLANDGRIQEYLDQYFQIMVFDVCVAPTRDSIIEKVKEDRWFFSGETSFEDVTNLMLDKVESLAVGTKYDRNGHFNELVEAGKLQSKDKKQFDRLCDEVKLERVMLYREIANVRESRNVHAYGTEDISIILGNNSVIRVKYPKLFLESRGHDIGDKFPVSAVGKDKFKKGLLRNIANCSNLFVPLDLALVFFELNEKVTKQANAIVKPPNYRRSDLKAAPKGKDATRRVTKTQSVVAATGAGGSSVLVPKDRSKKPQSATSIFVADFRLQLKSHLTSLGENAEYFMDNSTDGSSIVRRFNSVSNKLVIKSDGDCLFNAILLAVRLELPEKIPVCHTHIDLRTVVRNALDADSKDAHEFIYAIKSEIEEDIVGTTEDNDRLNFYDPEFQAVLRGINTAYIVARTDAERDVIKLRISDILDEHDVYKEYMHRIMQPCSFAGEAEIAILSKHFKVDVCIKEQGRPDKVGNVTGKSPKPIILYYNGTDHYDVVLSPEAVARITSSGVAHAADSAARDVGHLVSAVVHDRAGKSYEMVYGEEAPNMCGTYALLAQRAHNCWREFVSSSKATQAAGVVVER